MEQAGAILRPQIKRLGLEDGVRLARIRSDWHSIFAKPLSLHMSPSKLFEGELLLITESPLWMQQLHFCSAEITARLAPYGVKRIRFRVGKTCPPEESVQETTDSSPQLAAPESDFLEELGTKVKDAELREAIKAAAGRSITAGRKKLR